MSSEVQGNGVESTPPSGDCESLYFELLERYYEGGEGERKRALDVASRLEASLAASPDYAHSIRGEEIRSIIAELRDDLQEAIRSREAEIRKIFELYTATFNTPRCNYILTKYSHEDVSDRLDLLAILCDKNGELDRAIAILEESRQYCKVHRLPFDGQHLLDELIRAREASPGRAAPGNVPRAMLDDSIRKAYRQFGASADDIVVTDEKSLQFARNVNQLLPEDFRASTQDIKRRLLTLRRRGEARGGLPRLKP